MVVKNAIMLSGLTMFSASVFTSCSVDIQPKSKPNIVVILADDLGYGDIRAINGRSNIPTPNIDRLVSQGVLFTNAHASAAVCTPTRYSMLTGRYSWRSQRKKGVTWVWEGPMIENEQFTIGEMLQQQGYHSACIGKWHLGLDWPTSDGQPAKGKNVDYDQPLQNGPTDRGFDYYFGQEVPSFPPHAFIENDRLVVKPTEWMEPRNAGIAGAMAPGWRYEDLMFKFTDKAVQYLKDQSYKSDKNPFFLYFAMSAPHTPIAPHEKFEGTTEVGRYGDYVYEMDFHVGRILNTLDSLKLSEHTMVIFLSDNGGVNEDGLKYTSEIGALVKNYAHNSNEPLRGMKSDAYEGGHRVPFIVRWPGHTKAGAVSPALVSGVDLMATFAAVTGYELTDDKAEDSYSLLPLFEDEATSVREALVNQSGEGILSIQKGDWKLILCAKGGGKWSGTGDLPVLERVNGELVWLNVQLFNLKEDSREQNNLAPENQAKVIELMRMLKQYIVTGRSTAGKPLQKGNLALWREVEWVEEVQ